MSALVDTLTGRKCEIVDFKCKCAYANERCLIHFINSNTYAITDINNLIIIKED